MFLPISFSFLPSLHYSLLLSQIQHVHLIKDHQFLTAIKKIEIMKQKAVTHTKWQIRNTVPGNSFINRQILPSCILSNSELHNLEIFINTMQVNRVILKHIPGSMGRA